MATVNTRLQANPVLQRMPKNEREWVEYQNELAKWVLRIAKLGESLYTSDGGTVVDGLDEMPGQLASERNLKMGMTGNNPSTTSTNPLSSQDASGTATITVAAHVLATPSGDINYNGGSITGLNNGIAYAVYTDDPDYEGGTVTYVASTEPSDVVALGRYYLGTITTAVGDVIPPTRISFVGQAPGVKIASTSGDIVIESPAETPQDTYGSGGGSWGSEFATLVAR